MANCPTPNRRWRRGHEIIGIVAERGKDAERFQLGDRVGVPWLGWTDGVCHYCRTGRENLCDRARFTGYTLDGGYADYTAADQRFCFPIPASYSDTEAAVQIFPLAEANEALNRLRSGKIQGAVVPVPVG